jgi:hypothetical protein
MVPFWNCSTAEQGDRDEQRYGYPNVGSLVSTIPQRAPRRQAQRRENGSRAMNLPCLAGHICAPSTVMNVDTDLIALGMNPQPRKDAA